MFLFSFGERAGKIPRNSNNVKLYVKDIEIEIRIYNIETVPIF